MGQVFKAFPKKTVYLTERGVQCHEQCAVIMNCVYLLLV